MKTTEVKLKSILALIIVLFAGLTIRAQEFDGDETHVGGPLNDKIEAKKVAYITTQLDLTAEEAQKFWPVYNQFQKDREKLFAERPKTNRKIKEGLDNLTAKELEDIADGEILFAQKMLDLKKKYHAEYKKVLPMKKVVLLYQAEKGFRKELLKSLREHRGPKK